MATRTHQLNAIVYRGVDNPDLRHFLSEHGFHTVMVWNTNSPQSHLYGDDKGNQLVVVDLGNRFEIHASGPNYVHLMDELEAKFKSAYSLVA